MANYYQIQRECNRMNRTRDVVQKNVVSLRTFWDDTNGSFIVSGGSEWLRIQTLGTRIIREAERYTSPVIVLTANDSLEQYLIQRHEGNRLQVISGAYRGYRLFKNWDTVMLTRFFQDAANALNFPATEMIPYIQAFVDIICSTNTAICMESIIGLSKYSDAEIANIGRNARASVQAVNNIRNYTNGGVQFRTMLNMLEPMRIGISGHGNFGLLDDLLPGIYCFNIRSIRQDIAMLYFARELERLVTSATNPTVVLSDITLETTSAMYRMLCTAQGTGTMIGIGTINARPYIENENLLFTDKIVLLDDGRNGNMLSRELEQFGRSTFFFPQLADGSHHFLRRRTADGWMIAQEQNKAWVTLESVMGKVAVLTGDYGTRVTIAGTLRD